VRRDNGGFGAEQRCDACGYFRNLMSFGCCEDKVLRSQLMRVIGAARMSHVLFFVSEKAQTIGPDGHKMGPAHNA
jgi:hypothetical protein